MLQATTETKLYALTSTRALTSTHCYNNNSRITERQRWWWVWLDWKKGDKISDGCGCGGMAGDGEKRVSMGARCSTWNRSAEEEITYNQINCLVEVKRKSEMTWRPMLLINDVGWKWSSLVACAHSHLSPPTRTSLIRQQHDFWILFIFILIFMLFYFWWYAALPPASPTKIVMLWL